MLGKVGIPLSPQKEFLRKQKEEILPPKGETLINPLTSFRNPFFYLQRYLSILFFVLIVVVNVDLFQIIDFMLRISHFLTTSQDNVSS